MLAAIGNQRDENAFQELFTRHFNAITNHARHVTRNRALAEEAVQEGMLKVWRKAHTYIPFKARAWILQIVTHQCLLLLTTQARNTKINDSIHPYESNTNRETGSSHPEQVELFAAVNRTLHRLPNKDRQMIILSYCAGYTQGEIGRALSMPQRTVSFQLCGALKKMRRMLVADGHA